jgi:predicted MFS family arabinose efflux permease
MGTFTANFDLGMLVGSPLVGGAAALAGYSAAFYVASIAALACAALTFSFVGEPLPQTS